MPAQINSFLLQACVEDAAEILALQRLCFQSEAELCNNVNIPPLLQSLAELEQEIESCRVLKLVLENGIVASVRATMEADVCRIGRLIVHPRFQGQGLGTMLMARIESDFAAASCFEIFTGSRSIANLRLYQRLGYSETRRVDISANLTLVFLQKPRVS